jgi:hypothetical protein
VGNTTAWNLENIPADPWFAHTAFKEVLCRAFVGEANERASIIPANATLLHPEPPEYRQGTDGNTLEAPGATSNRRLGHLIASPHNTLHRARRSQSQLRLFPAPASPASQPTWYLAHPSPLATVTSQHGWPDYTYTSRRPASQLAPAFSSTLPSVSSHHTIPRQPAKRSSITHPGPTAAAPNLILWLPPLLSAPIHPNIPNCAPLQFHLRSRCRFLDLALF